MQIRRAIIEAAIEGFELRKQQLDEAIAELEAHLDGRRAKVADAAKPKRKMSTSARRRIAAAQKARWKRFHAKAGASGKKSAPKRKLSPAAKAKLVANLKKARAAKAAKAKAAAA